MAATSSGGNTRAKELFFDIAYTLDRVIVRAQSRGPAVGIGKDRVKHAGNQRAEAFPLNHFARGQRQRSQRAAMEAAVKRDELVTPGFIAGQFERRLDRLRAGVAEVHTARDAAGSRGGQLLGQVHHVFVVEIGAGHVDQTLGLLLDGPHHARDGNGPWPTAIPAFKSRNRLPSTSSTMAPSAVIDHQRITPRVGRRQHTADHVRSQLALAVREGALEAVANPDELLR